MTINPGITPASTTAPVGEPESIDADECWRLLAANSIARLAVTDDLGPDIFPINYLAKSGSVFFRSAPGKKIVSLTEHPAVAVEVDGTDGGKRFSVVIRGEAHRLNDDAQIHESGVLALTTMTGPEKWNYFELTPRTVTGKRFRTTR
ncbi:pyridoxamine 5'-phosphate oxidase family protein [Marisediminicola senii]|uniref:pyridoxamine 5'-phosphate oxidase family protein n=1 Tax=Marisediminicola senii TaxID=2711233 RepID=UPI0013E9E496|nr:pyridoxamine 5'-phosphate oxidase family protein [Marisediminicola senii]